MNRQQIEIAARLYEMHEAVRRLWPDEWRRKLQPVMDEIERLAAVWNCDVIQVLPRLQKISPPEGTMLLWLGAATVELIEPSEERIEQYRRQLAEQDQQIARAQTEAREI
jgi:type II secretory pathway component PulM